MASPATDYYQTPSPLTMNGQTCLVPRPLAILAVCCFAIFSSLSTLAAGRGQLGILDTSRINPNTGRNWVVGDQYRLVFISSENVDPTKSSFGSLDDIATWNAIAQSIANKSNLNLGKASWKVIGSSQDVDARDNTQTNPALNGLGHPIMLIDGSTIVARNYADLWDGRLENTITMTEKRGASIEDLQVSAFPYTGTGPNGRAVPSKEVLRALTPSSNGKIRQGFANHPAGWIDRNTVGPPTTDNTPMPIYVISDTLYVVDEIPEMASTWLIGLAGFALLRRRR